MIHHETTLVEVAEELKRLANSTVRLAKQNNHLPVLSSLTAMRPLVQILIETLVSEIQDVSPSAPDNPPPFPFGFCVSKNTPAAVPAAHAE